MRQKICRDCRKGVLGAQGIAEQVWYQFLLDIQVSGSDISGSHAAFTLLLMMKGQRQRDSVSFISGFSL